MFGKKYSNSNLFRLRVFCDDDLNKLHQGTLKILSDTGLIVDDDESLELFSEAGAEVDTRTKLVKIPISLVEEAITLAPSKVLLAGRGDNGFYIGDGQVRFCSFGEAPQLFDPYTQQLRNVKKCDVENYALIVDNLSGHDMCWDAWVPSDVPSSVYTLHSLDAYFNNTEKPVCIATPNGHLAQATVKMSKAVAGGDQALRDKPLCIAGTCPKSPLYLDCGICESIIILARAGVPNMNMSAVTSGGTGPVTLAGSIVVHNAEMLACLVLSQLAAKGAPFIYGACTSALDLRRATATFGCPELGMFSAAFSSLTKYYGLPNVVAGLWTDSKDSDMQCGHEKTLNGLLPALAGADMVFGTGCLAAGMIGSFGQLVADDEMITMMQRTLKGIAVDDINLALDIIDRVGPRGNFLAQMHTVKHMKQSQVHTNLLDRNGFSEWAATGKKTFKELADEKAVAILKNHIPKPLSNEVKNALAKIIEETEVELAKTNSTELNTVT
jgi:trimethylamine--corrinoid protein Co-methyltransferase